MARNEFLFLCCGISGILLGFVEAFRPRVMWSEITSLRIIFETVTFLLREVMCISFFIWVFETF